MRAREGPQRGSLTQEEIPALPHPNQGLEAGFGLSHFLFGLGVSFCLCGLRGALETSGRHGSCFLPVLGMLRQREKEDTGVGKGRGRRSGGSEVPCAWRWAGVGWGGVGCEEPDNKQNRNLCKLLS